jgi:integrase
MKKKHLSDAERDLLLDELRVARNGARSTFTRGEAILFEVLLRCGIRTDELMSIRLADCDRTNNLIHVKRPAKDSHPRACHVPASLMEAINGSLGDKEPETLISTLIPWQGEPQVAGKRALQRRWERARADLFGRSFDLGLHSLRHTAAYAVLRAAGSNLGILQAFLGHKSILSTNKYVATFSPEEVNRVVRNTILGREAA